MSANIYNGLSILDDMYSDGADDIVLFYRTFDHVALAPALRCSKPIGEVVGPQVLQARRDEQIDGIESLLYSWIVDMTLSMCPDFEDDGPEEPEFWQHVLEVFTRIVHRCTREAMSLDASIQKEFVD